MDKLAAAKAFLAGRYCLAIPVYRADQRPWVEPPPVPLYLRREG